MQIVINARSVKTPKRVVSHSDIVSLSGIEHDRKTVFTVTYRRGEDNAEGSLARGDEVRIVAGMIFDATPTGQS